MNYISINNYFLQELRNYNLQYFPIRENEKAKKKSEFAIFSLQLKHCHKDLEYQIMHSMKQ